MIILVVEGANVRTDEDIFDFICFIMIYYQPRIMYILLSWCLICTYYYRTIGINIPVACYLLARDGNLKIYAHILSACFVKDIDGRLPRHVALETGMKHFMGLVSFMNVIHHIHLGDIYTVTWLSIGALATMEHASDLDTINY